MNDAGRMRRGQRSGHLSSDLYSFANSDRPARKALVQCFAFNQLARDVARRIRAAHLVNRHDVRVIKAGDRTRFPLESSETLRIICEVRR